mgnify:CR=1 FL=1
MGAFWSFFSRNIEMRAIILGLDGAGKTTLLYNLHLGEIVRTIPTIGFNVERVKYKNCNFHLWDVGGQTRMRKLWHHYLNNTNALIYVVDSNDRERLEESKNVLHELLNEPKLANAKVLIFANKIDIEGCLTQDEIVEGLELDKIDSHSWRIQTSSGKKSIGITEGFDWILEEQNS